MQKYQIADWIVEIESRFERTYRQAEPYRTDDDAPTDFKVALDEEYFQLLRNKFGDDVARLDELEHCFLRSEFAREVVEHGGMVVHSSAVSYDGRAYLFSADSGVGKSTHTRQWLNLFGDAAFILNDDSPVVRKRAGRWRAYGSPWSGSSPLNVPVDLPLQGFAFVERAVRNEIARISPDEAFPLFLMQTCRPYERESMAFALDRVLALTRDVPIYRLRCLPNVDAARVAYETMSAAQF